MRKAWHAGTLLGLAAGLTLQATRVGAQTGFDQTRFAWPDTTVDVGTYTAIEQCLAATQRILDAIKGRGWLAVWRDTMPWEPERSAPLPAPVTSAARRCAARFAERTASLSDFAPLVKLYLQADLDTDATALLARRLRELGPTRVRERKAVMDSVFAIYLEAQPSRLDAAEALLRQWPTTERIPRLKEYVLLALASYPAGDTSRARRVALETLALADSLTPAERESDAFATLGGIGGKRAIYMVMFLAVSTDGIALDSLRHSTPAYVRFIRGMWPKDMGRPSDALFIIGEKAPPIVGDFWAPSEAASRPRPTPGHVALVMFLEHADCLYGLGGMTSNGTPEVSPQCFALAASLHRLAQRFPALQITTVTRTRGHFAYVSSPPPADEASLIEREMAAYHLPGALAIASTPFWRLPAPDDRRIDKPVANETHYRFGTNQSVADGTLFLIDQSGTIVYANNGDRWGTLDLSQFIDVLVHRGNDGAANESH